jgi:hypothetical protein
LIDLHPKPARSYPPIAWNRLVLTEAQGAEFLQMARSTFRTKAAAGEWPRYWTGGEWRYYAYDLLDWLLEGGRQGE